MAEYRSQPQHVQVHTTATHRYEGGRNVNPQYCYDQGGVKPLFPEGGPSTTKILAVLVGVPVRGTLLLLAGLSLIGTYPHRAGLAVASPLFILFSPVLVPAALATGLAVTGFLTSGDCGLTALSSFSWVLNDIRQTQGTVPEQLDLAKRRMADVADYVGQKTKEVGQDIQTKGSGNKEEYLNK